VSTHMSVRSLTGGCVCEIFSGERAEKINVEGQETVHG
jgi:hypothetical protein